MARGIEDLIPDTKRLIGGITQFAGNGFMSNDSRALLEKNRGYVPGTTAARAAQAQASTPSFSESPTMNSQWGSIGDLFLNGLPRGGTPPAPSTPSAPSQSARFKGGAPRRVVQPRTVSAPSTAPSGDSHGYAIVGGKRINYQDIGTKRDPLARNDGMVSTPEGGTMLLGNPTAYRPIPQEERSARGIADLTPQETLARNNERIQSDLATITANMGNQYDGEQQIAAAKMRIAALQGQNELLQRGIAGDQSLEGQKYVADMGLRGHQTDVVGQKYAADMGLRGHQIDRDSAVDVARLYSDAQIRSASLGRENRDNAQAAAEDKARLGVRNQVINSYDWTGISPTAANAYATTMAQTFDKPGYETFSDPQSRYNDVVLHPEIAKNFGPALRAARNSDEYAAILAEITRLTNGQGVHHTGIANTRRLPRLKRAEGSGLSELNIR